jgi:hypothetical protein
MGVVSAVVTGTERSDGGGSVAERKRVSKGRGKRRHCVGQQARGVACGGSQCAGMKRKRRIVCCAHTDSECGVNGGWRQSAKADGRAEGLGWS